MDEDIPPFLDRKLNGITPESPAGKKRAARNKIIWPPKRNWRKIEKRRREKQKLWDKGIL